MYIAYAAKTKSDKNWETVQNLILKNKLFLNVIN